MRVGPVGITNGSFGNRPHCIYRGFCLQGCKVNAKASPLVTHIPDAIEHGAEIRADCMVTRVEVDDVERSRHRRALRPADGGERFQRADAVAVAGYSIETPRLLLNSTSRRFPHGLANDNDQVGRCVMVQGAPQVAGRFPDEMRMYKAPPPEISSEQFYETDERRGFARGFSIQTVGPAADRLGPARAGARATGARRCASTCATTTTGTRSGSSPSCCRCPRTASRSPHDVTDENGMPVARMDYSQCENDRKNIAYAQEDPARHLRGSRRAGHAGHRPLRPPRRRLPDGLRPGAQRRRLQTTGRGRCRTCSSPTAA